MPRIKVLPPDLRNKIAAGEVVERPASVVKELIENSIDAGSRDIKIDLLYGGKRLIRVSDDGSGMDREDALLCFERHATSKLANEEDLFNITTLGFRGEALSSIASVSRVKITTGLRGSASGVALEIDGGELREVKDSPSSGTSVEIRDLFFNTPARKKFLKANSAELFHIIDTVTKEAISHPGIGFSLSSGGQETMVLPKASAPRERLMQIYGEEFLKGLAETDSGNEDLSIKAFISQGENFRKSKAHQFIFVNGRPIKDSSLSHAVYKAFEGLLPIDKHPVFFLFLEVDPRKVDFNVHPTKREVRFEEKERVYTFVNRHIRETVKKGRAEYAGPFAEPVEIGAHGFSPGPPSPVPHAPGGSFVSENTELGYSPFLPFLYLGDTFVATSGRGGLTLVDHHAAHERILYEKFLKRVAISGRHLLFPEQVRLSHKEYRVLIDQKDLLSEFGFEIDDFGHDTVMVRTVPDVMDAGDKRGILSDIAASIIEGVPDGRSLKETLAAKIACHSSVRGKNILNQEEFSRLLADLENTEHPDQCPHGRPTRIFYSLDDLKKMFKRK
jgi:DNA mismatch repair protein MutL